MKKIIFLICLIVMGCSKFDDGVTDLGYEITDDVICSYAKVNGVKVRADISPVAPVEFSVTEFYVVVNAFPEHDFSFKVDKTSMEDLAQQKEDESFEYNTLLQKTEFIVTENFKIPCFYLQETAHFKSVPKHLMPAPEISCVYAHFTSKELENEVVDDNEYEVRMLTFYFKVFEDNVEKKSFATTNIKFYKPKSFINIIIDEDLEEIYDEIVLEF